MVPMNNQAIGLHLLHETNAIFVRIQNSHCHKDIFIYFFFTSNHTIHPVISKLNLNSKQNVDTEKQFETCKCCITVMLGVTF